MLLKTSAKKKHVKQNIGTCSIHDDNNVNGGHYKYWETTTAVISFLFWH